MKEPVDVAEPRLQVDVSRLAEFGERLAGARVERHEPATLDARIESRLAACPRLANTPHRAG